MLVLSRKKNEAILIGEGDAAAKVVVVEIRGDKVRLGIEAPNHVPVHRDEVYAAIHDLPRPDRKKKGKALPGASP